MSATDWPRGQRIAVLAPHPDDFDAIAVTLRYFHARGDEIHLAVLTAGASGVESTYPGAADDAAKGILREAEQRASCAAFGLPAERVTFLRLAASELIYNAASIAAVRDWLLPLHAGLVFMPHGNDSNATHRNTYALFSAVAQQAGLTLSALLNQDAKTVAMRHDLYLPFDAQTADWKAGLLRLHATQHQRNLNTRGQGFDERVLAVNRGTAATLGLQAEFAEAFELEHWPPEK
ncbi:MAG TPA: PIG-L family deacetylase [Rhodocyclaceae bacterium]|nr:PIG-L family deacetylase [Rhodocyclaceae bacterium]